MNHDAIYHVSREQQIADLEQEWATHPRWKGIKRTYSATDIVRLRGSMPVKYSLAERGAKKLWSLFHTHPYINSLGALTGGQAMQQVKAGIKAIYLSGWQVAADNNGYAAMYPDQSLYPADSVPKVIERINNAFTRADEIQWAKGVNLNHPEYIDYFAPIIADAEAGFGGVLNAFELMKAMIRAGASGVHFEDQLASVKKCGHMGGKVLVSTQEAIQKLIAARMAADIYGVPTLIIARTDAEAADLITSNHDSNDQAFLTGERTIEGFYKTHKGLQQAISRAIAYADYADIVWCETGTPNLDFAQKFAEAVHKVHPGKLLAYNCSPSFNWKKHLNDTEIANFQQELGKIGYKYQFITLAGVHNMWFNMFDLTKAYIKHGMTAYIEKVQEPEFAAREHGYTFVSHQQEVGTGYFDDITTTIQGGHSNITALKDSTESSQFH